MRQNGRLFTIKWQRKYAATRPIPTHYPGKVNNRRQKIAWLPDLDKEPSPATKVALSRLWQGCVMSEQLAGQSWVSQ